MGSLKYLLFLNRICPKASCLRPPTPTPRPASVQSRGLSGLFAPLPPTRSRGLNCCDFHGFHKAGAESLFSISEWEINIIFFSGSVGSLLNSFKPKERIDSVSKSSNSLTATQHSALRCLALCRRVRGRTSPVSLRFPGASAGDRNLASRRCAQAGHKIQTSTPHPPPRTALQSGLQPQLPSVTQGRRCRPGSGEGSL